MEEGIDPMRIRQREARRRAVGAGGSATRAACERRAYFDSTVATACINRPKAAPTKYLRRDISSHRA